MNWNRVDLLLANCSKQAGLGPGQADPRLRDYSDFLSLCNGAEGFVGTDSYIVLWSAEQLLEMNDAYRVSEFAPGIILIGTNGGDTGYGIEAATGRYVSVPIIGMSREDLKDEGACFEDFLENCASS